VRGVGIAGGVCVVVLGAAHAGAAETAGEARQHRVGIDLGAASAVGVVGVGYQFAPVPWLRLEGAVGWGPTGTQLSFMPKIAPNTGRFCTFTAGAGAALALGGVQAKDGPGHEPRPDPLPWLNVDVSGIECRTSSGFSWGGALGVTVPLKDFHWDLADTGETMTAGTIIPQTRAGIGWWF
jgi:hypothetical protein